METVFVREDAKSAVRERERLTDVACGGDPSNATCNLSNLAKLGLMATNDLCRLLQKTKHLMVRAAVLIAMTLATRDMI